MLLPSVNEVWGKVILLHLFVILFTGGSTWGDTPGRYTPRTRYTTPRTRYTPLGPGTHTPWTRYTPPRPGTPPDQVHPPAGTPWDQVHSPSRYPLPPAGTPSPRQVPPPPRTRYTHPPRPSTPPRSSACWEIRATSGRYASYWNAFLFWMVALVTSSCFVLYKNHL